MKNLYFIAGLPRSGATLLSSILKQNSKIYTQSVSSLSSILSTTLINWNNIQENREYPNEKAKFGVFKGILDGYYDHVDRPIIFDQDLKWINQIGLLESIMQKEIKMVCMVRNPAEILTSYEKIRKNNPATTTLTDLVLGDKSSIAARAFYYAGPDGILGKTHAAIKDAVTMGYLTRMLFVDYNRFCNSPKSQMRRVYDFFELPEHQHDFENIEQNEKYNDIATNLPGLRTIKTKLNRTTTNCVEYLGLDLYNQYNREIFWDAWI